MLIDSIPCNFEHRGPRYNATVTSETKVQITDTVTGMVVILDEDSAMRFNEEIEGLGRTGIEQGCRIYFERAIN